MTTDDAPIPRGVSRETLLEILAGWYEAGAAEAAVHTGTVADRVGHPDATGRQTRFLESIGALEEADDQQHRLTDRGTPLAAALAEDDTDRARQRAYGLLAGWPLTVHARDLLRGDPLGEDDLLERLVAFADTDLDAARDRIGLRTLVEVWTWADTLDRTDDGRYLPGRVDTGGSGVGTSAEETLRVGLELSVDIGADQVAEDGGCGQARPGRRRGATYRDQHLRRGRARRRAGAGIRQGVAIGRPERPTPDTPRSAPRGRPRSGGPAGPAGASRRFPRAVSPRARRYRCPPARRTRRR